VLGERPPAVDTRPVRVPLCDRSDSGAHSQRQVRADPGGARRVSPTGRQGVVSHAARNVLAVHGERSQAVVVRNV